jgi:DNA-binding MarR family transcriptional regulator
VPLRPADGHDGVRTGGIEEASDIERFMVRLCRLVVDMEAAMTSEAGFPDLRGGLDTPGLGVLLSLDLFGPLRPGTIGQILGISSGGTSKLVERLHRAGLVTRTHDAVPGDRRAVLIEVTGDGRDAIRAFDWLLVERTPDLLVALREVRVVAPAGLDTPAGSGTGSDLEARSIAGPALAELFRLVAEVDRAVVDVVGDDPLLQPSDPRPLLILLESHLRGGLAMGDVPGLVGRSRGATNRIVGELVDAKLVVRKKAAPREDQRTVSVELTPKGRRLVEALVDAQVAALPVMVPAIDALTEELIARAVA